MKDRDYYINKYLQMGTEYLNVDLTCIVPKLVNEMMTELEAISSSCDGCINRDEHTLIRNFGCYQCKRYYSDMYETKDKE